jgi:hypothetical protein
MSRSEKADRTDPWIPGYCSFCRKDNRDVGPLAAAPGRTSSICYGCLLICKELLEEHQRRGRPRTAYPGNPVLKHGKILVGGAFGVTSRDYELSGSSRRSRCVGPNCV